MKKSDIACIRLLLEKTNTRQPSIWQSVKSNSMGLSNLEAGYEQMSAGKTMIDMQIETLNATDKNVDQLL